jgi:hypothetical protein
MNVATNHPTNQVFYRHKKEVEKEDKGEDCSIFISYAKPNSLVKNVAEIEIHIYPPIVNSLS